MRYWPVILNTSIFSFCFLCFFYSLKSSSLFSSLSMRSQRNNTLRYCQGVMFLRSKKLTRRETITIPYKYLKLIRQYVSIFYWRKNKDIPFWLCFFFQDGRSELFSSLLVYASFGTYIFIHLFMVIEKTVKVNLLLRNTKQKKNKLKLKKKNPYIRFPF